jgi:hypothetical protein
MTETIVDPWSLGSTIILNLVLIPSPSPDKYPQSS